MKLPTFTEIQAADLQVGDEEEAKEYTNDPNTDYCDDGTDIARKAFLAGRISARAQSAAEISDLRNALENILKYVSTSTDLIIQNAVYFPPAEQLRKAAKEIELKDKQIREAREILTKYSSKV